MTKEEGMTLEKDRAPGQGGATESTAKQIEASLQLDEALVRRAALRSAYAAKAARLTAEESVRLATRASELAARALDTTDAVSVSAPTPAAEDLPAQPADVPSFRADRPPGAGENQMSTERLDEVVPR
jgi:hypothetical protein